MRATTRGRTARRSPRSVLSCAWLVLLAMLPAGVLGQDTEPPEARPAAASAAKIPAAQIPSRTDETSRIMRGIRERLMPSPEVEQIQTDFEAFAKDLNEMEQEPLLADLSLLNLRTLDELDQRWSAVEKRVRDWQKALADRATALGEQLALLQAARAPWTLTYEDREADELPEAIVQRVEVVLEDIEITREQLSERLDAVLRIQNSIGERLLVIEDVNNQVDTAAAVFRDRMLVTLDGPPLWRFLQRDEAGPDGDVQTQMEQSGRQSLINARAYLDNHPDRVIAVGLAFAILSSLLLYVRARRRARHAQREEEDVLDVLSRPIASALLISVLLAGWIFENPPPALLDLLRIAAALPVYLIMRRVVPERIKLPVYALILLYVLDMGGGLLARQPEVQRLIDLVIAGAALGVVVSVLAPGGWASSFRGGAYWRWVLRLLKAAALLLTVAVVANVVGAIGLAALLTDATLTSAYIGLGLYAIVLILHGLIDTFQHSRVAAKSRGISRNPESVRAGLMRAINLIAALLWAAGTLRAFRLLESTQAGLLALFEAKASFGNFSVSLSDIFAFAVALWAGFAISRLLRFVLNEDVFPRISLPRGVPSAISSMAHYAILTIAFFIALAVAGIELGKFAIIAGAVGVGIGFGLQNIVNNFVSGLILLFERPIQAGDSVEMGTLFGRVVRIGIRSSTVRTFQGAEVIVPNADLIAKEVINWTLTDAHRRLEIPVGVTYNAEPREVIRILIAAARSHKEVLKEPEPFAIFVGYGASSIDFELRAWISNFNEGLRIKTDLLLDIWDRLEEAGIEIPFPQQDLHLKTVDGVAAATLAGRPPPPTLPEERAAEDARPEPPRAIGGRRGEGVQLDPDAGGDAGTGTS